jgi:hypothetical protein
LDVDLISDVDVDLGTDIGCPATSKGPKEMHVTHRCAHQLLSLHLFFSFSLSFSFCTDATWNRTTPYPLQDQVDPLHHISYQYTGGLNKSFNTLRPVTYVSGKKKPTAIEDSVASFPSLKK